MCSFGAFVGWDGHIALFFHSKCASSGLRKGARARVYPKLPFDEFFFFAAVFGNWKGVLHSLHLDPQSAMYSQFWHTFLGHATQGASFRLSLDRLRPLRLCCGSWRALRALALRPGPLGGEIPAS